MDNLVNKFQSIAQQSSRGYLRWTILGLILLSLVALITGCPGGGGPKVRAKLTDAEFTTLGKEFVAIEQLTPAQLKVITEMTPAQVELAGQLTPQQLARINNLSLDEVKQIQVGKSYAVIQQLSPAQLQRIAAFTPSQLKAVKDDADLLTKDNDPLRTEFVLLWQGYVAEFSAVKLANDRQYAVAQNDYQLITTSGAYGMQAKFRLGLLDAAGKLGPVKKPYDIAKQQLRIIERIFGNDVWVRTPSLAGEGGTATITTADTAHPTGPTFAKVEMAVAAAAALDSVYRKSGDISYRAVDAYISWFKLLSPTYGSALALIVLALIIKIITIPMTTASFRGMRDMQRVQPLIKELQEKYKDDKAKQAEAQMKLMKEHKVSPLGGCLPMLIQIPIFIVVYQAVQLYSAGFASSRFIWIESLARPDLILLVLYAASMVVTQKLTATPPSDPQQKMMQTQMTYMMPVMMLFVLYSFASAFVLYWFWLNVFSSVHQYYLLKKFDREDAERAGAQAVAVPAPSALLKKKKGK